MMKKHSELCGLPGCGKTTYVNQYIIDNSEYIGNNEYINYIKENSKKVKFKIIVKFLVNNYKIVYYLIRYFISIKIDFITAINWAKKYLYFIACLKYIYPKFEKEMIMDQGVFQLYWSLLALDKYKNKRNFWFEKLIINTDKLFNYNLFYLRIDPLVASERAGKRNSEVFYDKIPNTERNKIYVDREKDFDYLFDVLKKNKVNLIR